MTTHLASPADALRASSNQLTVGHEEPGIEEQRPHRTADMMVADSQRSRPCEPAAGFVGSPRLRLRRLPRALAAAAALVLGASLPGGVGGEGPTLFSPALHSPAFVAGTRAPSSSSSSVHAHTRAPLLAVLRTSDSGSAAPFQAKIGKIKSMDDGIVKLASLNWPDVEGSPVSEIPETPVLRASMLSPLPDFAKGIKGVQMPSANNLRILSVPQLETELVSAEEETDTIVDAVVCGVRALKSDEPIMCAPSPLGLDIGWSSIPHPLKVARGGEDSHIIARLHGVTLLGVFDGVGGWAELGVDPAEYARRLGRLVETALVENPEILEKDPRPLMTLLTKAFDVLDKEELAGSCTASLALLTADSKLHVLNVGDSGKLCAECVFSSLEMLDEM